MTVIAWDGKTLAADKQSTAHGYGYTVTKIHSLPDGMVGFMGSETHAHALLQWFCNGHDAGKWPKPHDPDSSATALFINKDGRAFGFDGPNPMPYEDTFIAFGCGRDYALAAMYLGHDAETAVKVACALDVNCGKGIDTLTLSETA